MVEVMETVATSFKRSRAPTATLGAPDPAAGHCRPTLRRRLLDTHRQVWSVSVGSLSLPPGSCCVQSFACARPESVSSVFCKFWRLSGGLYGSLLQESLCHTQVCCTQSPCPCGRPPLTRPSTGDAQTQFWLSLCGVSVSWCTRFV